MTELSAAATELLDRIGDIDRKYNQPTWPPATWQAIEAVVHHAVNALGTEPAADYLALLRKQDGLMFNGYAIYGAETRGDPYLAGFAKGNEPFTDEDRPYVLYGETADELFGQDRVSGIWLALDRSSLSLLEEFANFDAMLIHILELGLE